MKRNLLVAVIVTMSMSLIVNAGTISGKVSGVSGESVVYVDVVQGKTFPAPEAHPLIDQKGLMFTPVDSTSQEFMFCTRRREMICSG